MLTVAGLLFAAVALAASPPTARPRVHLDVHVDAGMTVNREDLREALALAVAIWKPVVEVSVSLPWAGTPAGAADALRVRIADRGLPGSESGLAWIPFVDGEPQSELTVSMPGVRQLLQHGSWNGRPFTSLPPLASALFVQRAIGRAVAHELGHYLLRSRAHERRGLMRAVFSVDEIMKARPTLGPAARSYAMALMAKDERAANDAR